MQPWTIGTLVKLAEAAWFSRVGVQEDAEDGETAIVVTSWPEAMEHAKSHEWELLRKEALARYCTRVADRSMERWRLFSDIHREVNKFTDPLVARKIAAVVREHNLPKIFEAQVRSDIAALCIESEYADVYPPSFFAANAYWYVHGHFPCGWRGDFPPKGQLVVY
jgi:hypothetical protein